MGSGARKKSVGAITTDSCLDCGQIVLESRPALLRGLFQQQLFEWVERKRKLFSDDRRIIAHLRLKNNKRRLTVEAASYDYDNPEKKPE